MKDHRLAIYLPPSSLKTMRPYKGDKIWVHDKSWNELFSHVQRSNSNEYAFRFVDPKHPMAAGWFKTPYYWSAQHSWVRFIPSTFQVGEKTFKSVDYATKLALQTGVPVPVLTNGGPYGLGHHLHETQP